MAVKTPQGFEITSNEPIDTRLVLTKGEMRELSKKDRYMPDTYFAILRDYEDWRNNGALYYFDKHLDFDSETGKFRGLSGTYKEMRELPTINEVTILGDQEGSYYSLQNLLIASEGIKLVDNGNYTATISVDFDSESIGISDNKLYVKWDYVDSEIALLKKYVDSEDAKILEHIEIIDSEIEIIDARLDSIDSEIISINDRITSEVIRLDKRVDDLKKYSDSEDEKIRKHFNSEIDRLDSEIVALRKHSDSEDEKLRKYIDSEISDLREYTDSEILKLRKHSDSEDAQLLKHIDSEVDRLDSEIFALRKHSDSEDAKLLKHIDSEIEALRKHSDSEDDKLRKYVDSEDIKIIEHVDSEVARIDSEIVVIDDRLDIIDSEIIAINSEIDRINSEFLAVRKLEIKLDSEIVDRKDDVKKLYEYIDSEITSEENARKKLRVELIEYTDSEIKKHEKTLLAGDATRLDVTGNTYVINTTYNPVTYDESTDGGLKLVDNKLSVDNRTIEVLDTTEGFKTKRGTADNKGNEIEISVNATNGGVVVGKQDSASVKITNTAADTSVNIYAADLVQNDELKVTPTLTTLYSYFQGDSEVERGTDELRVIRKKDLHEYVANVDMDHSTINLDSEGLWAVQPHYMDFTDNDQFTALAGLEMNDAANIKLHRKWFDTVVMPHLANKGTSSSESWVPAFDYSKQTPESLHLNTSDRQKLDFSAKALDTPAGPLGSVNAVQVSEGYATTHVGVYIDNETITANSNNVIGVHFTSEGKYIKISKDATNGIVVDMIMQPTDIFQAGAGINISGNVISATQTAPYFAEVLGNPYANSELAKVLNAKQNTLIAGDHIKIDGNTISALVDLGMLGGDSITITSESGDLVINVSATLSDGQNTKWSGSWSEGYIQVDVDPDKILKDTDSESVPSSKAIADYVGKNYKKIQDIVDTDATAVTSSEFADTVITQLVQDSEGRIVTIVRKNVSSKAVNDGKLYIKNAGSVVGSFSANQSTSEYIDIVYDYNYLLNKPTINDGKLKVTYKTPTGTKTAFQFTANQAGNTTSEINVGTVVTIGGF